MKKTLEEYLKLSYPIELVRDLESGAYFGRHPDLDGCMAQGATADDAVANLGIARELWIETRLEDGLPVPEPLDFEPSGRVLVRMAPWLHGQLMRQAQRQDVSLNQYIVTALAEFVGGAPYRQQIEQVGIIVDNLSQAVFQLQVPAISWGQMPVATNMVVQPAGVAQVLTSEWRSVQYLGDSNVVTVGSPKTSQQQQANSWAPKLLAAGGGGRSR